MNLDEAALLQVVAALSGLVCLRSLSLWCFPLASAAHITLASNVHLNIQLYMYLRTHLSFFTPVFNETIDLSFDTLSRGAGVSAATWAELLRGPAATRLTQLNGLQWTEARCRVVSEQLALVARRKTLKKIDLRWASEAR
jgi:hypothetical protein